MSAFSTFPPDALPERSGPAAAVRTAVLGLFARLGAAPVVEDEAARARMIDGMLPPLQTRRRTAADGALRLRAHAAHAAVEGGGPAALDAALDVLADEIDTLERRARHQAEALKAIRLYAPEPWVRRIAQQALAHPDRAAPPLPDFLVADDHANDLDDAEISVMAARFTG